MPWGLKRFQLMSEPEKRDPSVVMQVLKQEFAEKYLQLWKRGVLNNRVPHSPRSLRRVCSELRTEN